MAGYWMGVLLHEIAYEHKLRGHEMTMASEFLRSQDGFNLDADRELTSGSDGFLKEEINRLRAKLGLTEIIWFQQPKESGKAEEVSANVNERKHSHYFKPVAHLAEIDVYRICDLYCDDRSGATQHAIKKLLLPGERGAGKSREKDYQEAIDTLRRKLAMLKEDAQCSPTPSAAA